MSADLIAFPVIARPVPKPEAVDPETPITLAAAATLIITRLEKAIGTQVAACFLERMAADLRSKPTQEPSQ